MAMEVAKSPRHTGQVYTLTVTEWAPVPNTHPDAHWADQIRASREPRAGEARTWAAQLIDEWLDPSVRRDRVDRELDAWRGGPLSISLGQAPNPTSATLHIAPGHQLHFGAERRLIERDVPLGLATLHRPGDPLAEWGIDVDSGTSWDRQRVGLLTFGDNELGWVWTLRSAAGVLLWRDPSIDPDDTAGAKRALRFAHATNVLVLA
jgi:hypothetical protein